MPAGELRERIRFERRVKAGDDGYGNVTYEWQAITAAQPANLSPQSGDEPVTADLLRAQQTFTVTVRYSKQTACVMTNDRAVNVRSGDTYDLIAIANPDERRRFITMTAVRGGAEA